MRQLVALEFFEQAHRQSGIRHALAFFVQRKSVIKPGSSIRSDQRIEIMIAFSAIPVASD
jgi:hypothetical protein